MAKDDFTVHLRPHPQANGAKILEEERQRSSIDVDGLSKHLFGTSYLERQARVLSILQREKVFSKTNQANLSRPDRYKLGLARGKRMRQLMDEHHWNEDELLMAEYLIDDTLPYHLHLSLFNSAMREQTSDSQRAHWMGQMESWQVIGAYAQTELGHGSNVRGIELEATWDRNSHDFVLHSPTLTSSKWWNGTLGRTATHAVVMAQLKLPGGSNGELKSYGVHPFVVEVRDSKTHKPPSTIVVGDIGPKYGYAPMDNAYMLFNHHRVPHSALLCRYASVDSTTGEYKKPSNPSSVYGSLTRGRAIIVMSARLVLARAVTVAVRYLSIRRQFRDRDNPDTSGTETAVLDYSTVQIRVLTLLATTFALHYSGEAMRDLYERTRSANALDGDRAQLAELHSTSAGLKSLATDLAANGIEICRRAMGGHGFSGGTGLVQLNADYLSKPTVEGDNWMITQQAARYLLNRVGDTLNDPSRKGRSVTEANLHEYHARRENPPNFTALDEANTVKAFAWRVSSLAFRAYDAREVQKQPWNSLLIDLYKLSRAYSQSMLVANFKQALETASLNQSVTKVVLRDLFELFALFTMDAEAREFQKSGAVSADTLDSLPDRILELMRRIRPHAVRLVDSFSLPDFLLDSALGRSDGRVYEDLFNRAHVLNPLNKITFNPNYHTDEIVMGSGDGGDIMAKL